MRARHDTNLTIVSVVELTVHVRNRPKALVRLPLHPSSYSQEMHFRNFLGHLRISSERPYL